jgi:hypothetical protein
MVLLVASLWNSALLDGSLLDVGGSIFLKSPPTTSSSDSNFVNFSVLKLSSGRAGASGVRGVICGRAETPTVTAKVAVKNEVLMIRY